MTDIIVENIISFFKFLPIIILIIIIFDFIGALFQK